MNEAEKGLEPEQRLGQGQGHDQVGGQEQEKPIEKVVKPVPPTLNAPDPATPAHATPDQTDSNHSTSNQQTLSHGAEGIISAPSGIDTPVKQEDNNQAPPAVPSINVDEKLPESASGNAASISNDREKEKQRFAAEKTREMPLEPGAAPRAYRLTPQTASSTTAPTTGSTPTPTSPSAPPSGAASTASPSAHESVERFITRKENRPPESISDKRYQSNEAGARYATYSRSEVDNMLKLQTENITSALGSKISSQQRVFQEAVDKQEKAFQKISDRFVSQFDQTRVKLESLTKESQTSIQGDLENFKRDLSKELEQHRAQINKTVVPVAKFIEDKNTNPPEKIKKEAAFEKPVKNATVAAVAAPVADNSGLKNLILANLAIVVIGLGILLTVVFAQAERIEKLQAQITDLATNTAKSTGTTSGGNTSTSVPSPTSSGTAPATGTTSPPGQQ